MLTKKTLSPGCVLEKGVFARASSGVAWFSCADSCLDFAGGYFTPSHLRSVEEKLALNGQKKSPKHLWSMQESISVHVNNALRRFDRLVWLDFGASAAHTEQQMHVIYVLLLISCPLWVSGERSRVPFPPARGTQAWITPGHSDPRGASLSLSLSSVSLWRKVSEQLFKISNKMSLDFRISD